MENKHSFSGPTSSECPNANIFVVTFIVITILLYISALIFRVMALRKILKMTKVYLSGHIKEMNINKSWQIVVTISLFIIVIWIIGFNIFLIRIREIYIFNHSSENLRFEKYEIYLGGILTPIPTNYWMIIVAYFNICSIKFADLINSIMSSFEKNELVPSIMMIKNKHFAALNFESNIVVNDQLRAHANTDKIPELEK